MLNSIKKNKKIYLIAEACDNHFGSLDNAKLMVRLAKKNGADIIKFQHHIPDEEMLPIVPKSKNFKLSLYKFLKKYALKLKDHEILKKYCKKNNITYLCTPFSYKAAKELNELGVSFFKVGSGEFTDLMFIEKLLKFNKPIIFSTGMSSVNEINFMYRYLKKNKFKNQQIAFMNCTSEYPPRINDINLKFILQMQKNYSDFIIGHSDHTNSIYTSLSAASLGARIIEKHVYLDDLNFGPDRDVSISFKQLNQLSNGLNIIEKALGRNKKIYPKEQKIRSWARRSLVSLRDLFPGEKITKKDFFSKRPGIGIPSKDYKKIIGKKVKKKINKNSLIRFTDFK